MKIHERLFQDVDYRIGKWGMLNLNQEAIDMEKNLELDFSKENPLLSSRRQEMFVKRLHQFHKFMFSYGGYLEDRSKLWQGHYHKPDCMIHLGMDFNVPDYSLVRMPFSGEVVFTVQDKDQNGGWGGRIDFYNFPHKMYFILAHLDLTLGTFPNGKVLPFNDIVGIVGNPDVNGGWFPHLHLQVMTKAAYESFDDPMKIDGYGSKTDDLEKKYLDPQVVFDKYYGA